MKTITLETWVDHGSIRPDEAVTVTAAVALKARAPARTTRPPLRTVLALDVSTSMRGTPLAHVVSSVERLLDALDEGDELGIVTFSDDARVLVPVRAVDAAGKREIRARVRALRVESRTNIEAGLNAAARLLAEHTGRRSVLLLSDGAPNLGARTEEELRAVVRAHRPAISFFALGYGTEHAEQILAAIGDAGGAGYEYVPDPLTCARAFARALGAQGDAVARGLELRIAPAEGVELVRFVGKEETRFGRGGVTVALPDLLGGAERFVAFELRLRPGRDRFLAPLAELVVGGSAGSGGISESCALSVEIADRAPRMLPDALRRILLVRADEARDAARALADRGQHGSAVAVLRSVLSAIEGVPGFVLDDGSPLAEAQALIVDEIMVFERRPAPEAYAAFRKGTVGARLSSPVPSQARARGEASQKLLEHVAGDLPDAWLLVDGRRHPLREECIIGRTQSADVQIANGMVSRRHAQIFANAGDFWVCDLGSTNPTVVNGAALRAAPHRLVPGDVIVVGEVALRYEERRQ